MSGTNWQDALRRTRRGPLGGVAGFLGRSQIGAEFWDALEGGLVRADLGIGPAEQLIADLRKLQLKEGWKSPSQVLHAAGDLLGSQLKTAGEAEILEIPHVVMLQGVNGSGKTTTAARIGHRWLTRGRSVLLAAADTFRAAATDQLQTWAGRLGVECVAAEPGSDPGAVVYNALQKANSASIEVVIVDTSGRMHTSHNLMGELAKLHRVAGKQVRGAPQQSLLVLDATTGQNGLAQARAFLDTVPLTAVVLTKLDSSAKGGVAVQICRETGLPLLYAGIGEALEDLVPFDSDAYLRALLADAG